MEKTYTKEEVRDEADRYLKEYIGYNVKSITDAVWSDYTNMPSEYRRQKFATSIITRIRNISNNVVNNILGR